MAVFAIGDIQGCFDDLQRLLERLDFDAGKDRLWFTGDLVNRGPKSLETLRFVRDLGDGAISVLGNHDLHLLAVAEGFQEERPRDTMRAVLEAPDAGELLDWLRQRPLAHHDAASGCLLVHGGLPPEWDIDTALGCARDVESALRGSHYRELLRDMYGNEPAKWREDLAGIERLRYVINAFTRIRYCTADGKLDFTQKGPPGSQPPGLLPWFEVPGRKSAGSDVLFGHWSTLRDSKNPRALALDTGCLWGGKLTALRVDGGERRWMCVECGKKVESRKSKVKG